MPFAKARSSKRGAIAPGSSRQPGNTPAPQRQHGPVKMDEAPWVSEPEKSA